MKPETEYEVTLTPGKHEFSRIRIMPWLAVAVMVLVVLLSCDRSTPLGLYEPRSVQERAIKSLLLEFQDGVIRRDAGQVMGLIHEQASIMIDRKFLSRAEYARVLPQRLAEDNRMDLGKPRMTVSGDQAEVKIYMTRGDNRFLMIFRLVSDNERWYIHSWEY